MAPLRVTRAGLAGTVVMLVVAATCVRLGIWQLDRLEQRRERNALISAQMTAAPIQLSRSVVDSTDLLYRSVELSGTFDHAHSVVLPGRAHHGVPGVHLLTPLLLDHGRAVLVNRGWVPSPDAATIDLTLFGAPAHVRLDALIVPFPRLPGTGGAATAENTSDTIALAGTGAGTSGDESAFPRILYGLDFEALLARLPYEARSIYVRALPSDEVRDSYPLRLEPPALDEGPHLGYAIQWFSFAAIAVVGWATLVLRREARNGNASTRRTSSKG